MCLFSSPSPDCHGPCRNKQVRFTIVRKITPEEYIIATFGAFGMFVGAYLIVVLVSCLLCVRRRRHILAPTLTSPTTADRCGQEASLPRRALSRYGSVSSSGSSLDSRVSNGATRRRIQGIFNFVF
jgi:hypothetical protein